MPQRLRNLSTKNEKHPEAMEVNLPLVRCFFFLRLTLISSRVYKQITVVSVSCKR